MTPSPVDMDDPTSTAQHSPADIPAPTIADVDMDIDKIHSPPSDPNPIRPMDLDHAESDRPAKRARTNDDVPPVQSKITPISTFSPAQHKFASSTVRTLRKNKDAAPFLFPVDIVALNIPHYPHIIKHPMDFSTIDHKLNASKPGKEDTNVPRYLSADDFIADVRLIFHNTLTFNGPDHVVTQMAKRLEDIFERQVKHMPPPDDVKPILDHSSPPDTTRKNTAPRRPSTSTPVIRRNDSLPTPTNGNTPHISTDTPLNSRPKRDVHPPTPKDGYFADGPNASSSKGNKPNHSSGAANWKRPKQRERDDGTADQLKFCTKIISDLFKKQYYSFAYFFYDPVDAAQVPNYYNVIKKPMDLTTMRKKLEQKEYENAAAFHNDFRLLIKNCETFNPARSLVRECGEQLKRVFEEKWAALPPLREYSSESDDNPSDVEEEKLIQAMEGQIATLTKAIEQLRDKRRKKEKKKVEDRAARKQQRSYNNHASSSHSDYEPSASSSKPKNKPRTSSVSSTSGTPHAAKANGSVAPTPKRPAPPKPKTASTKKGKPGKREDFDDDDDDTGDHVNGNGNANGVDESETALDLSQKKELSETIEKLDEAKLEKVIQIIQEGIPGIGNNSEEIELEIDSLPPAVLQRLYNFVVKPIHKSRQRAQAAINKPPGARTGSGNTGRTGAAATGGVKRKSMDEVAEAEKIRIMEEKMKMFERGGVPPTPTSAANAVTAGTNGNGAAHTGGKEKNGPGMGAGHDEDESVSDSSDDDDDSDSDSD